MINQVKLYSTKQILATNNVSFEGKKKNNAERQTIKDLTRVPVETLMAALMLNLGSAKLNAANNRFMTGLWMM